MIIPINGHIIIEPLKYDSFIPLDKGVYEEIGLVKAVPAHTEDGLFDNLVGKKVYFDSWLASKYPTGKGDEYFWLVKMEDVRAIEYEETPNEIPK
jgi:hypothetical protein